MKRILLVLILVCCLRLLSACGGGASGGGTPLTATHFSVTAQGNAVAGTAFNITVTALDAANNTVTTYSGTVHFTSSDAHAVLPGASVLTDGIGTFSVTLMTPGTQTVTATDTASNSGTSNSITVTAPATHFAVTGPSNATTGIAFNFAVTALDASNDTVTTYSGTVHFTSSDGQASLPTNSALTSGTGTFSATLKTLGSQTIAATDTMSASITGTSSLISVGSAAPTHYSVQAPSRVGPGNAFNFSVTALDAANNPAPTYAGTVHFTSTDPLASLPANSTLTNGTGTFSATLNTTGSQTITATDTAAASITGSSNPINVVKLAITSGNPPNGTVGKNYGPLNECIPQGFVLSASGGFSNLESWTASSLPPGLQIGAFLPNLENGDCRPGPATWIIYGVPTQAGTFNNVTVTVHLGSASASATYAITIAAAASRADKAGEAISGVAYSTAHHHYKVIDIGTFGGPSSYFDDLHLTDNYGFNAVFYNFSEVLDRNGAFVGFADTAASDPYSANPVFCYVPDCFVTHAYQWQNGETTDLGALTDGASSAAFWINSNGLIAGNSENGEFDPVVPGLPELRAVIWRNGKIQDLGTLGGSSSFSQAVNDRGQATGLALNGIPDPYSFYYQYLYCLPYQICPANATETRGFVWDEKEGMQDIGTLGGPDAFPSLINQHGQIAGFSYTDSTSNPTTGFPTLHPFLWEKGKGMKDLGSLGGTTTASVNGLNERGEVVGGALLPGDEINHPFLWDGEKLIDLVARPFGGSADGEAFWINEAGEVVGIAGIPAPCPGSTPSREAAHAFLWRNGAMTDLGALPGSAISQANFINSRSQIVGDSTPCDFSAITAFLWENGSLADLNTLISPSTPIFVFTASFISDQGEIAAFGALANGDQRAVLLIPCDENHPDLEGCDYSLVDPATSIGVQSAHTVEAPAASPAKLPPPELLARARSLQVGRSRRYGTPQTSPW
jgi:probable HAF family extracellular repeat protein